MNHDSAAISIRWLMLAVIALAVILRLVIVAVQISNQSNSATLSHLRVFRDDKEPFVYSHGTTASSYWGEYWRKHLAFPGPAGFRAPANRNTRKELGRETIDVDCSHDLDAMDEKMAKL